MRCISFAGSGIYQNQRYCRDNLCVETDLTQEAIWRLYGPDEIILCLSDPSGARIASDLDGRKIPLKKLWIPFGTDEKQLYEIFSTICGVVIRGEEILFEITAGYHSLPFITLVASSYLHSVMQVTITGIVYAPGPGDDGFCRFVDLKPIMNILNWIKSVNALTDYLDAEPIIGLLSSLQTEIHRSGKYPDPPVRLTGWSTLLGKFCDSIQLARPVDAMYAAYGITREAETVRKELHMYAPSLVPVINEISVITGLAAEPEVSGCSYEYVRKQVRLIDYQIEKGLYLQAVTLGREVLITLLMIKTGFGMEWKDTDLRHEFSRTLTGGALSLQKKEYKLTEYSSEISGIKSWKEMVMIWIKISELRNNLAHCGMTRRNDSVKSLKIRTKEILPNIERFMELCENE